MELELRHLRVLCAIAEAGSLGRAAVALGQSQPALSTQLRRIERHLGGPLFRRLASGVAPTEYGREVVAQAREVLARMASLGSTSQAEARPARETLRLAATNSSILSGMVARARSRLPEVKLTVSSVYASSAIVDLLERGEVDAAIAADYPGMTLRHSPAVAHRGIVTEPVFVALPTGHRLRRQSEVALAELAEDAWFVTPDDGAGWPGVFYEACAAAGFRPQVEHEFIGDRLHLQAMIADGLGVSLVQATMRPSVGVLVKPLTGTPLWCRYVLAWRRDRVGEAVAEALYGAATATHHDLLAKAPHFQAWAAAM